jgi:hypothetical protein
MNIDSLVSCLHSIHQQRCTSYPEEGSIEEQNKWATETYDYFRHTYEPYIYNYLTINYGAQLSKVWETHTFPKTSKKAFVIVERRCHPNWWFLLRNLAWAGPDFSLYIFCSIENYDYIQSLLGNKKDTVHCRIIFQEPASPEEGKRIYQRIYKDANIYKSIDADYCITVELDTYFLKQVPDTLLQGDYYGASWSWDPSSPGGGGLSVRNIKTMIEVCEKDATTIDDSPQDCWMASRIVENQYKIPPYEFRQSVFVENTPSSETPYSVHQFWTFMNNFQDEDYTIFTNRIKKMVTITGLPNDSM